MSLFKRSGVQGGAAPANRATQSFLPEDYIERRNERRMTLISAGLFSVVTAGVVGAFFVTNRQWSDVSRYQQAINVRYSQAAQDIEQLKTLEEQKQELIEKAELTTVLLEKVPRSILLAEIINRMPPDMTLLELQTKSTRLDGPKGKKSGKGGKGSGKSADKQGDAKNKGSSLGSKKSRSNKDEDAAEKPEVSAPKLQTAVTLIGVAPSHQSVAAYVTGLQECALLEKVELKFSEVTIIRDVQMNKFRIEAGLRDGADARRIEPGSAPTLNRLTDGARPGLQPETPAQADGAQSKEDR